MNKPKNCFVAVVAFLALLAGLTPSSLAQVSASLDKNLSTGNIAVKSLAFNGNGNTLAAALADGSILLYSGRSLVSDGELTGHSNSINDLVFSGDTTLYSASSDRTARAWNTASNVGSASFIGHRGFIEAIAINASGSRLATGGRDGLTNIWDTGSNRITREIYASNAAIISLAFVGSDEVLSINNQKEIFIWSASDGSRLATFTSDPQESKAVAVGDGVTAFTGDVTGDIFIWNKRGGIWSRSPFSSNDHLFAITDLSVSANGKRLASVSSDGKAVVWDVASKKPLFTVDNSSSSTLALRPDGQVLAVGSSTGGIRVFSTADQDLAVSNPPSPPSPPSPPPSPPPVATIYSLNIAANVPVANIIFNGQVYNTTNGSVTINNLTAGSYSLVASAPNYRQYTQLVTVNAQNIRTSVNLERLRGDLTIKTDPGQAEATLNNQSYSAINGTISIKNVETGNYDLVVKAAGYDPYTAKVTIGEAPKEITVGLNRITVSLTVLSNITDGELLLDGKKYPIRNGRVVVNQLVPDFYPIQITATGFRSYSSSITLIASQKNNSLTAELIKIPELGKLNISNVAANARIFLNDSLRATADAQGRATIGDLEAGNYTVRVSADGYEDFVTAVSIQAGAGEQSLMANARRVLAEVTITSNIANAKVQIVGSVGSVFDGQTDQSRSAQAKIDPGRYAITVSAPGYKDFSISTTLSAGKQTIVADLDKLVAKFTLTSNVANARVSLDDKIIGNTDSKNTITAEIDPGTYTVVVSANGYEDFRNIITLRDGQQNIQANLLLVVANFTVVGNVAGAEILVGDKFRGVLNEENEFNIKLPPGNYPVTVKAAGYRDFTTIITLKGGPQSIKADLQRLLNRLTVSSNVAEAKIKIDNIEKGGFNSQNRFEVELEPSQYTVVVSADGYEDFRQTINLTTAPQTVTATLNLAPVEVTISSNITNAQVLIETPTGTLTGTVSGSNRLFSTKLRPGSYKVRVVADGYSEFSTVFEVGKTKQAVSATLSKKVVNLPIITMIYPSEDLIVGNSDVDVILDIGNPDNLSLKFQVFINNQPVINREGVGNSGLVRFPVRLPDSSRGLPLQFRVEATDSAGNTIKPAPVQMLWRDPSSTVVAPTAPIAFEIVTPESNAILAGVPNSVSVRVTSGRPEDLSFEVFVGSQKVNVSDRATAIVGGNTINIAVALSNAQAAESLGLRVVAIKGSERIERQVKFKLGASNTNARYNKLYFLGVGINNYLNDNAMFKDLKYAENDVIKLKEKLEKQQGIIANEVITKVLTGTPTDTKLEANRFNVDDALVEIEKKATQDDLVILFFSGHGESEGDNYYFLTRDTDPNRIRLTSYNGKDLQDTVSRIKASTILLIDACKAGVLIDGGKSSSTESRGNTTNFVKGFQSKEAINVSKVVITASTGSQLAYEDSALGNGLFTSALLEGLDGKGAEQYNKGRITVLSLQKYLEFRVPELGKKLSVPQAPSIKVIVGDADKFVLQENPVP
jgi:WD40 repeat protein